MAKIETKLETALQEVEETRRMLAVAKNRLARAQALRNAKKQVLVSIESNAEEGMKLEADVND